ncbi:hypothetical protein DNTS_005146 [Danionella cerebrum]|uniref:Secretogranin-1 n=1 Tax=Danionella cerebrum TaxID=2873325 RepID=A0A553QEU8_9TELE|nr:hypothetical protein DNTS_005146 [Danionella translucida]
MIETIPSQHSRSSDLILLYSSSSPPSRADGQHLVELSALHPGEILPLPFSYAIQCFLLSSFILTPPQVFGCPQLTLSKWKITSTAWRHEGSVRVGSRRDIIDPRAQTVRVPSQNRRSALSKLQHADPSSSLHETGLKLHRTGTTAAFIMKFAALVCVMVFLAGGSSHSTVTQQKPQIPQGESQIKDKELDGGDPNAVKREENTGERSQEEFPSFIKRRIKDQREAMDDERSQEAFPSFMKRIIDGKLEELEGERSQEEFPSFMKRRLKERREEFNDERSQEEFPGFYKRSNKLEREDPEDERSQEEFPMKRYLSLLQKRDDDRSQEEFPQLEYKRSRLLTSRDKREESDYDRSQEAFPSYPNKRGYRHEEEEDEESEDREKRIWKPSHRYHHKKKYHKRDETGDFEEPDYDRSQEDFPSFPNKRNTAEGDEENGAMEKRIWKPSHRYHHKKKYHKRDETGDFEEPDYDRSQEDFPSFPNKRNTAEGDEENGAMEKRIWKPSHRYHHKKKYHKRDETGDFEEPDYDRSQEDFPNKRNTAEGEDEENEAMEKRIWKPSHRYHHKKKYHKRDETGDFEEPDYDRSQEEFPSLTNKRSQEDLAQEIEKRYRRPLYTYQRKSRGDLGLAEEVEPISGTNIGDFDQEIAKRYRRPLYTYQRKTRGAFAELGEDPEPISDKNLGDLEQEIAKRYRRPLYTYQRKSRGASELEPISENNLGDLEQGIEKRYRRPLYTYQRKTREAPELGDEVEPIPEKSVGDFDQEIAKRYRRPLYTYTRKTRDDATEVKDAFQNLEELAKSLRSKRSLLSVEESPEEEMGLKELENLVSEDQETK